MQYHAMDGESIKKLMAAVGQDFFKLCVNRCGSHVIQALFHAASRTLSSQPQDQALGELLASFVATVKEKLSDCIRHPYASHVLGGVLQDLGGVSLAEQMGRSRYSQEFRKAKMFSTAGGGGGKKASTVSMPEWCADSLDSIAKKIAKMSDLEEMLTHQNGSPVLQCLLYVLAYRLPARGQKVTKKILKLSRVLGSSDDGGSDDGGREGTGALPDMFTDMVGSHLVEAMIASAQPDLQQLIFNTCFRSQRLALWRSCLPGTL